MPPTLLERFQRTVMTSDLIDRGQVSIETLDNPGWIVKVPFTGSLSLEDFGNFVNADTAYWIDLIVRDGAWKSAGGAETLGALLAAFLMWVEADFRPDWLSDREQLPQVMAACQDSTVLCLQEWFIFHCDEDWEHGYGVVIRVEEGDRWTVLMYLDETIAEDVPFEPVDATLPGGERYRCWVEDCVFHGKGTKFTLEAMCRVFCDWVAPLLAEASNE